MNVPLPDIKKEPDRISFEFKLRDRAEWPSDFVTYIGAIVRVEKWTLRRTPNGLLISLPPNAFPRLQGWLELRGMSPEDEKRFV